MWWCGWRWGRNSALLPQLRFRSGNLFVHGRGGRVSHPGGGHRRRCVKPDARRHHDFLSIRGRIVWGRHRVPRREHVRKSSRHLYYLLPSVVVHKLCCVDMHIWFQHMDVSKCGGGAGRPRWRRRGGRRRGRINHQRRQRVVSSDNIQYSLHIRDCFWGCIHQHSPLRGSLLCYWRRRRRWSWNWIYRRSRWVRGRRCWMQYCGLCCRQRQG